MKKSDIILFIVCFILFLILSFLTDVFFYKNETDIINYENINQEINEFYKSYKKEIKEEIDENLNLEAANIEKNTEVINKNITKNDIVIEKKDDVNKKDDIIIEKKELIEIYPEVLFEYFPSEFIETFSDDEKVKIIENYIFSKVYHKKKYKFKVEFHKEKS